MAANPALHHDETEAGSRVVPQIWTAPGLSRLLALRLPGGQAVVMPVVMIIMVLFGLAPRVSAQALPCETGADCPVDARCFAALGLCGPSNTPQCEPGPVAWDGTSPLFVDRTEAWGLEALNVLGVRINTVDIDGDGWADLVIRRGGTRVQAGAPDSEELQRTFVLRNLDGSGFEDVTFSSAMLQTRQEVDESRGRPFEVVAFGDVDNDGDLDVYTGTQTTDAAISAGETSEILLNDGNGIFELGPGDSALRRAGDVDAPAGAAFLDVDRDGHLDLWVAENEWYPDQETMVPLQDRLYRGDGRGGYVDMTVGAGLTTEPWENLDALNSGEGHTRAWSANACDLNADGYPELLASSYGRSPNHLWLAEPGEGGVTYRNISLASGYAFDENQTWQDNLFAQCFCETDPTSEGCADVELPPIECRFENWDHDRDRQPFRLGGNSGATVCADIDNDGDIDLLTGEIRHWWGGQGSDGSELLLNQGGPVPTLVRPGDGVLGLEVPHPEMRWDEGHMTAAIFDVDNDGWRDVLIGASDYPENRALLYRQVAPLSFELVPMEAGIEHPRAHGMAIADFDRDGDLDVVLGHSRSRCGGDESAPCYPTEAVHLFENLSPAAGNWVQLTLVGGPSSNRAAIGARVEVQTEDLTQTFEVSGGFGHFGAQNDLVVHAGLGGACEALVRITWPDVAQTQEVFVVSAGSRYRILQGTGFAKPR